MPRSLPSLQERLDRAKQIRKEKIEKETLLTTEYRLSKGRQVDLWVRILFFSQVLTSFIGFVYFPFHATATVTSYTNARTKVSQGIVKLDKKKEITLMSYRLKDFSLQTGSKVQIEQNLFLKEEAMLMPDGKIYFYKNKAVWVYLQSLLLIPAIVSMGFKPSQDLRAIRLITFFLILAIIGYFIC